MYYGARYYDAANGRFVQPDSLIPDPYNPQSLNRYSYVRNNPVRYRDPSGHWVETLWDIANIAWDVHEFQNDPSWINGAALVVDVAAAVLPAVPAGAGLIARGGKAAEVGAKVAGHADDVADAAKAINRVENAADAAKAVDAGVAAYRGMRGGGIHSATTGKAFSDWFKANILKDTAARGKYIRNGERRLDIVDEGKNTIYELKNYTKDTSIGKAFWDQAEAYVGYAHDQGYTLKYVFGEKISDDVAKALKELEIEVYYIDDAGKLVEWIP